MKRSMRNILAVTTSSTALLAALSLGFSGCKQHRQAETSYGSAQGEAARAQNSGGHAGAWTAQDAQVAAGQPAPESKSGLAPRSNATSDGASFSSAPIANTAPGDISPTSGAHPANSGMNTAPNAAISTAPTVAAQAPKETAPTCFVETFKHKSTAGHDSEEACSHHKNLVSLSHKVINPKSVCVRVNETPVKFQTVAGGELLIGSVAGPKAIISVSYCTGKNTCEFTKKNDCVVPKDEFLDAIGGSDTDEGAVAQWENTGNNEADVKLNSDVKRELADIDDAAPEHPGQASVFKDWTNEKTIPSCGQTTAQVSVKK